MIPKWQAIVTAFTNINAGMRENKYIPDIGDPNPGTAPNPVEEFKESTVL